jgi:glycosyltransferase involved in cell wall biosynthesis
MRIGLNLLYLIPGLVGGTETYAAGLLTGLTRIDQENEYVVFVNRESANWPLPKGSTFVRMVCPVSAVSRPRRYFFEQFRLPALLKEFSVEVVHSLGYISPLYPPCPAVVTIHDLNYRAFGQHMPFIRRVALDVFMKQSALRAQCVITVSEFSQREIAQAFHVPVDRIVVTHEAPRFRNGSPLNEMNFVDVSRCLGIKRPYMIAFSSQSPNKNIPRLLQAFAQAKEQYQLPHQLVLVGHQPMKGTLPPTCNDETVYFTGYLDDRMLQIVFHHAQMLVFPSFYEGFGLPILEAMAAGVPVVCSNKASLPEVAGDAAVFSDPYSVDDMARKIAQVALDTALQDELRRKGFQNLQRFSWEKTAYRTLEVYESVVTQSL